MDQLDAPAAQHGRPPDRTGDYELVDPGSGAALDAIWHDPRLQPSRRGISPRCSAADRALLVPLAGHVLLNLLSPDRRRRFIVERGEQLLRVAAERCAAIQGEPRVRLAELAGLRARRSWPSTCRPPSACSSPAWPAAWRPSTWCRVLTRGPAWDLDDRVLEITRGLPNNPTTEMDLALWQISQAIRGDAA